MITTDFNWRLRGACRDEDPDLFFPSTRSGPARFAEARKVCNRCTVQVECLASALRVPESQDFGVSAGTTPSQRVRIRRIRNAHRVPG
jgi:WhiB family redox-sensing transcriptional regulator